jgi:predicted transposase YdaD
MAKYDAVLKLVLQRWGSEVFCEIIGEPVTTWHNVELPQVSVQFADLLAETDSGALWHVELQASNDPEMPVRMLEYAGRVYRRLGKFPKQAVLYVGRESMHMKVELVSEDLSFRYRLVNASDLDSDALLTSCSVGDNVMAILTRLRESRDAVRKILEAIASLDRPDRDVAFEALLLLASLRELEETVEKEARHMPVFDDILDNKVLGREYKRGLEQGMEQGLEQGLEQGRQREVALLRTLIDDENGNIPGALEARISRMSPTELEDLARRVSHAATIDDLLS